MPAALRAKQAPRAKARAPGSTGKSSLRAKASAIRLLALDVDGTLTDGRIFIGSQGEMFKAFDVSDGQGLTLLARAGIKLAIITGRESQIVSKRAAELKFDAVVQAVKDKSKALKAIAKQFDVPLSACAMMGDDWPDLAAFSVVGFTAAPVSAHLEVRLRADWVSLKPAGQGAVRELCDLILQAQGQYERLLLAASGSSRASKS